MADAARFVIALTIVIGVVIGIPIEVVPLGPFGLLLLMEQIFVASAMIYMVFWAASLRFITITWGFIVSSLFLASNIALAALFGGTMLLKVLQLKILLTL